MAVAPAEFVFPPTLSMLVLVRDGGGGSLGGNFNSASAIKKPVLDLRVIMMSRVKAFFRLNLYHVTIVLEPCRHTGHEVNTFRALPLFCVPTKTEAFRALPGGTFDMLLLHVFVEKYLTVIIMSSPTRKNTPQMYCLNTEVAKFII